mmetsp:Transcript_41506/g.117547  ORF Transcript_41506/g.117547 Transcript_41506/m.117547 type:complete len:229 (+) Transcript_41506:1270-1956(+)
MAVVGAASRQGLLPDAPLRVAVPRLRLGPPAPRGQAPRGPDALRGRGLEAALPRPAQDLRPPPDPAGRGARRRPQRGGARARHGPAPHAARQQRGGRAPPRAGAGGEARPRRGAGPRARHGRPPRRGRRGRAHPLAPLRARPRRSARDRAIEGTARLPRARRRTFWTPPRVARAGSMEALRATCREGLCTGRHLGRARCTGLLVAPSRRTRSIRVPSFFRADLDASTE